MGPTLKGILWQVMTPLLISLTANDTVPPAASSGTGFALHLEQLARLAVVAAGLATGDAQEAKTKVCGVGYRTCHPTGSLGNGGMFRSLI